MAWTLDLLPLAGGGALVSAAPFKSARVSWAVDGTGALEVSLRDSDVASGNWLYGRRRVAVRDAGTRVYQGWLDRLERGGSDKLHPEYRAASRGLAAALAERVVHGDTSVTAVTATSAVATLLSHIDAQTDDVTNFTMGTVTGTARTVTRNYCDGEVISELIAELAGASPGGFDWEIDENGAFNAWVNGRGTDQSATVSVAPGDCMSWECTGDTSEMATYVTGIADPQDETPCGPPLVIDYTAERTTYGRREIVVAADSPDETELEKVTTEELRARVAGRFSLRTSWIEGRGPWDFGDVWLGDTVSAELGAAFGGNADVRCIGVSVSLEPGEYEFVEMDWEAA